MSARPAAVLGPAAALAFILAGFGVYLADLPTKAHLVWTVGLYVAGVPIIFRTLRGMLRGVFAADLVATLAIAGAMALDQPLAGLVVALMQTGGEALEHYAERRASQAVRELEAQAPRIAHRLDGERVTDIAAEHVRVGDLVLVRPGEMSRATAW